MTSSLTRTTRSAELFELAQTHLPGGVDSPVRAFRVALGHSPLGHKRRHGDGRTPEGRYWIDGRNPKSRFRRALHISYPSRVDALRARRRGFSAGGEIMIHGRGSQADWTAGCVALDDTDIRELYRVIPVGTRVEIRP